MKSTSVNPSCLEEIAELTKQQKEIRREKNRITAKISRDKKNSYIHNLETMLLDANSKIETLEKELSIAFTQLHSAPRQDTASMDVTPQVKIEDTAASSSSMDVTPQVKIEQEDDDDDCSALDGLPLSFDSDDE